MTVDPQHPEHDQAEGPFGSLDPKLNVFALANGMDLEKASGTRRLRWYRDRKERAILLEAGPDALLSLTVLAWETGDEASAVRDAIRTGLTGEALAEEFSATLEQSIEAANTL